MKWIHTYTQQWNETGDVFVTELQTALGQLWNVKETFLCTIHLFASPHFADSHPHTAIKLRVLCTLRLDLTSPPPCGFAIKPRFNEVILLLLLPATEEFRRLTNLISCTFPQSMRAARTWTLSTMARVPFTMEMRITRYGADRPINWTEFPVSRDPTTSTAAHHLHWVGPRVRGKSVPRFRCHLRQRRISRKRAAARIDPSDTVWARKVSPALWSARDQSMAAQWRWIGICRHRSDTTTKMDTVDTWSTGRLWTEDPETTTRWAVQWTGTWMAGDHHTREWFRCQCPWWCRRSTPRCKTPGLARRARISGTSSMEWFHWECPFLLQCFTLTLRHHHRYCPRNHVRSAWAVASWRRVPPPVWMTRGTRVPNRPVAQESTGERGTWTSAHLAIRYDRSTAAAVTDRWPASSSIRRTWRRSERSPKWSPVWIWTRQGHCTGAQWMDTGAAVCQWTGTQWTAIQWGQDRRVLLESRADNRVTTLSGIIILKILLFGISSVWWKSGQLNSNNNNWKLWRIARGTQTRCKSQKLSGHTVSIIVL